MAKKTEENQDVIEDLVEDLNLDVFINKLYFLHIIYMAESWIEVVNRVFKENRRNNPKFKLKQAMKIAKKIYKKTAKNNNVEKNMNKTKKYNKGTRNYRDNRNYKGTRKNRKY